MRKPYLNVLIDDYLGVEDFITKKIHTSFTRNVWPTLINQKEKK